MHVGRPGPAGAKGPAGGTPGTVGPDRWALLRRFGQAFHGLTALFAVGVMVLVGALVYELVRGARASIAQFGAAFLTGTVWDPVHAIFGAGPLIIGTVVTSFLGLVLAVPVALGVAIFLSEIAPPRLRQPLTYLVDLGAAVPSVVYGFWAFIVLVPFMRTVVEPAFPLGTANPGYGLLTATIILAVMIIPTIAAFSREALRAVPQIHRESALSLGATRWETTRLGVLRSARSGIAAGVVLGLGRALGETIAVAMVIGNLFVVPPSIFGPGSTIASWIVNNFTEAPPGLERSALIELALILFAITFLVNVGARLWLRRLAAAEENEAPRPRRLHLPHRAHHRPATTVPIAAAPGIGATAPTEPWRQRALDRATARTRRRHLVQALFVLVCAGCVGLALWPFASLLYTAAVQGGPVALTPGFYTSAPPLGCNPHPNGTCPTGGIGPEIEGTLLMLGIGALIALPGGLLAGIYLAEYGRGRFAQSVSFLADVLTGVPTLILGVFVFGLFLVFYHEAALSALAGGVALGVLMLPIGVRASEEALRTVPASLRESALALGFPRHRVTLRVVLGSARGALVTGMLLALSRAAGDTATLYLTAGGSAFFFASLSSPTASITPFIFNNFGSNYVNLQNAAWGAALVLLALMLAISLAARLVTRGHPEAEGAG